MQLDIAVHNDGKVAAIVPTAPSRAGLACKRPSRENSRAVVALHALYGAVRIAERFDFQMGKQIVGDLGFLQTKRVGLGDFDETPQMIEARANGIDVPGGNGQRHADGDSS